MDTFHSMELKQIEKRAYQSIWRDGLVDIFVGIALIVIGASWLSQNYLYGTLAVPILVPIWSVIRKRVSLPRTGVVDFSAERVARDKISFIGLYALCSTLLIFAVAWYVLARNDGALAQNWVPQIVAGLPTALLAIPAIFVAFRFELPRFLIYAAILFVSAFVVVLLAVAPGWGFLPAGVTCITVGGSMLFLFLKKYTHPG